MNKHQSIHLTHFPDVSHLNDEKELMIQMDRVQEICTAALAVREKENIRVRQPLSTLTVYGKGTENLQLFSDIIRDEINVKEVVFSDDLENVATKTLKIHFPVAGKRLGANMKDVANAAKEGKWHVDVQGVVISGGVALQAGEYDLALVPKNNMRGAHALPNNETMVVLECSITESLKEEGIARDIVRTIQQARKDADLSITDRIAVVINAPLLLHIMIDNNMEYIKEQVLATSLICGDIVDGATISTMMIEQETVHVWIKKI